MTENGATSRLARIKARALELARQVPPLTSFRIAMMVRAEFPGSRWPNARRVHSWITEEGLDRISRVGKMPRWTDKETVLKVIRQDREQFERTGAPKYANIEQLAKAIGVPASTLSDRYGDALAYRRLRTSKWPHGVRGGPKPKRKSEWED